MYANHCLCVSHLRSLKYLARGCCTGNDISNGGRQLFRRELLSCNQQADTLTHDCRAFCCLHASALQEKISSSVQTKKSLATTLAMVTALALELKWVS